MSACDRGALKRLTMGLALLLAVSVLSGCGGGEQKAAVEACEKAVLGRIDTRIGEINIRDMRANARRIDKNTIEISSYVDFERHSPRAYRQTFNCRVVLRDPDGTLNPRVLGLQFNW